MNVFSCVAATIFVGKGTKKQTKVQRTETDMNKSFETQFAFYQRRHESIKHINYYFSNEI